MAGGVTTLLRQTAAAPSRSRCICRAPGPGPRHGIASEGSQEIEQHRINFDRSFLLHPVSRTFKQMGAAQAG